MNRALPIHNARKGIHPGLTCCIALLLVLLTGCGQKGPLFLPETSETESVTTELAAENEQISDQQDEDEDGSGL